MPLSQVRRLGDFASGCELSAWTVFPLGLLAAAQVGSFVVPRFGWEYMFLVGGIPGLTHEEAEELVVGEREPQQSEGVRGHAARGRLGHRGARG